MCVFAALNRDHDTHKVLIILDRFDLAIARSILYLLGLCWCHQLLLMQPCFAYRPTLLTADAPSRVLMQVCTGELQSVC